MCGQVYLSQVSDLCVLKPPEDALLLCRQLAESLWALVSGPPLFWKINAETALNSASQTAM